MAAPLAKQLVIGIMEERKGVVKEYVRGDKTEEATSHAAAGDITIQKTIGAAVTLDREAVVGGQNEQGDQEQLKGELDERFAHVGLRVSLGNDPEDGVEEHNAGQRERESALQYNISDSVLTTP